MSDAGICRHCGFPATLGEVCPVAPWDPAHGRPSGAAAATLPLTVTVPKGARIDPTEMILALMRSYPECEGAVRAELLAWRRR